MALRATLPRQPGGEAAAGFFDVVGRAGEGKTDPAVAVDRVEIAPRSYRDPGLGEELPAGGTAILGQRRDVGIEIERALGRCEARKPGLSQRRDQPVAVGAVARDMAVQFGAAAKHRERGELR